MMRNARQGNVARGASTPPPVKGLNTTRAYSDLKEDEAAILDNWFPEYGRVSIRNGSISHAYSQLELHTEDGEEITDETGEILITEGGATTSFLSLLSYSAGGNKTLFAATSTDVYDVSSTGQVTSADITGLSGGYWSSQMFATSGGNFLFCANGVDAPRYYDGSTWTTPSITGITPTDVKQINVHKRRLWLVLKDALKAAYFPVETIAGSVSVFDLGPIFRKGGSLVAMGTLTRDGGDGLDDLAAFITSEGEVAIYQGTDPSSANTWGLVGVFQIGRPIGPNCLQKLGPELLVLCEDGFGELSQVITRAQTEPARLSRAIAPSITLDARQHFGDRKWQFCFYPKGQKLFVNVPDSRQYVMNTETLAWTQFRGWNASAMIVHDGELYVADGTEVYKADTGTSDRGEIIDADALTGAQYMGARGRLKRFTMCRPILETTGTPQPTLGLHVDFKDATLGAAAITTAPVTPKWGTAQWGDPWGVSERVTAEWQSVDGIGYSAGLRMKLRTKTATVKWLSTDWLYEPGGYV